MSIDHSLWCMGENSRLESILVGVLVSEATSIEFS